MELKKDQSVLIRDPSNAVRIGHALVHNLSGTCHFEDITDELCSCKKFFITGGAAAEQVALPFRCDNKVKFGQLSDSDVFLVFRSWLVPPRDCAEQVYSS
jgi:hypothetical protein